MGGARRPASGTGCLDGRRAGLLKAFHLKASHLTQIVTEPQADVAATHFTNGGGYVCPGERYVISHAVHLARLATGFVGCQRCPLGHSDKTQPTCAVAPPTDTLTALLTEEGIRGTWRNQLDLATAAQLAAAFALKLREEAAAAGRRPEMLPVVVGYDDRQPSPQVAVAVGQALRQYGAATIDIGLCSGPAFRFAVAHLEAAGGVLATGSGHGSAVVGLDFAVAGGRPLSRAAGLTELMQTAGRPMARPTRSGGSRREFDATTPYIAGLWRHFRNLALVSGVIGCSSPTVLRSLTRLATELPTQLHCLTLPHRAAEAGGCDKVGLDTVAAAVRARRGDFGLLIDADGTAVRAVDEQGRPVAAADLAWLLLTDALQTAPQGTIAVDWTLADALADRLPRCDLVRSNATAAALFLTMQDHAAIAGADAAGRFWTPGPATDALVTLARLLRVLGSAGEPLSQRLATRSR